MICRRLGQQPQGVGQDVDDCLQLLDAALWRAGRIEDDRQTAYSRHAAAQPTERTDEPHSFGETRSISFDDELGALGRQVPRRETGTSGRDNQARKPVRHLCQHGGDGLGTVGDDALFDHLKLVPDEAIHKGSAALVLPRAVNDSIRDSEDFGLEHDQPSDRVVIISPIRRCRG